MIHLHNLRCENKCRHYVKRERWCNCKELVVGEDRRWLIDHIGCASHSDTDKQRNEYIDDFIKSVKEDLEDDNEWTVERPSCDDVIEYLEEKLALLRGE